MNPAAPAPDLRDLSPQLAILLAAIIAFLRALLANGFPTNAASSPAPSPATPVDAATQAAHRIRNPRHLTQGRARLNETPVGWDALERPNKSAPKPRQPLRANNNTRLLPSTRASHRPRLVAPS